MVRQGQTTTLQERVDITERAAAGQSDSEIAAVLGCSVWTVRKWRRLGQHQGRTGLSSHRGRPTIGPLGTLPMGMREAILQMRRTHPSWGSTALLAELRVDPGFADQPLPSRSRIAALLSAEKLTRRYQKHRDLPAPVTRLEGAPHDEWELDAASPHARGRGRESVSDHHTGCGEPPEGRELSLAGDHESLLRSLSIYAPPRRTLHGPATTHLLRSLHGLL
jgi:hypothetical protein